MKRGTPSLIRSKPKQDRSQDLVRAVLQATRKLVRDEGITQVSTNRIADLAGVSVGSLYRYYSNKEAIVAALIEDEMSRHLSVLSSTLERAEGLSDASAIELVVGALCDLYYENAAFLSALSRDLQHTTQVQVLVLKHLGLKKLIAEVHRKRGQGRGKRFEHRVFVMLHAVIGVLQSVVESYPDLPERRGISTETVILAWKYLLPLDEARLVSVRTGKFS